MKKKLTILEFKARRGYMTDKLFCEVLRDAIKDHKCEVAIKNSENGLCQRYCRICGKDMK